MSNYLLGGSQLLPLLLHGRIRDIALHIRDIASKKSICCRFLLQSIILPFDIKIRRWWWRPVVNDTILFSHLIYNAYWNPTMITTANSIIPMIPMTTILRYCVPCVTLKWHRPINVVRPTKPSLNLTMTETYWALEHQLKRAVKSLWIVWKKLGLVKNI